MRGIRASRDRTGFQGEFKFSEITRGSLVAYYDLIDHIEASDLHLAACVVNRSAAPRQRDRRSAWRFHADVATQLLVGCINRRELVTVLADAISTPPSQSFEDTLRYQVNKRLGNTSIVGAACLDSRTSDGLQVADLLAGSVAFEYRRTVGGGGSLTSNKAKVVNRLRAALGGVELVDTRDGRVNVAYYRSPGRRPKLAVVPAKTPVSRVRVEHPRASSV